MFTQKNDQEGFAGLEDISYIIVKKAGIQSPVYILSLRDRINKVLIIFSLLGTGLTKA